MTERLLITKLKRVDQTRAELYGKGHQFKDLVLFDLADLAAVGRDGASLPIGVEMPCRFWAVWEYSDRVNRAGNRYRDVVTLESIDSPATTTSTDTSAVVTELRRISSLLAVLVAAQGLTVPPPVAEPDPTPNGDSALEQHFPRYGDGSPVGDNESEEEAYREHIALVGSVPGSVQMLRDWVLARKKNGGCAK